MPPERLERRLAALLSADAVGYSRLMADDDVATIRTLEGHRAEMSRLVGAHRGRVVDSPGDNLLAEFPSSSDAVACALAMQTALAERNASLPEPRRLVYRIGVHVGEVVAEGERIYGDGVNVAARLEALSAPGGVCISGAVREQVQRLGLSLGSLGKQELKNIPFPVEAFQIRSSGELAPSQRRWRGPVAALTAIGAAGLAWLAWPEARLPELPPPPVPAAKPGNAIAVLPFVDVSPGADQGYFSDGLTEELIHELAQDPGLRVVARTSAFAVRDVASDVREIGAHLGVGSLVEGSVRKDGDRLRVTVQLVRADDGFHLWSQTYDRTLADIFRTQAELAAAIRSELRQKLAVGGEPRAAPPRSANPRAYEAYLRGRAAWQRRPEGLAEATRHFERALELDPDLALAHAGLADAVFMRWHYEPDPELEEALLQQATASARRAATLDPALAAPHVTLGLVAAARRSWETAEAAFRSAVELEPGDANAHHQMAGYLTRSGRFEEAEHHFDVARSLDPLSPVLATDVAFLDLYRRDYESAIRTTQGALALRSGDPSAVHVLASAYTGLGRSAESREAALLVYPAVSRPLRRAAGRVLGSERAIRLELADAVRESGRPCTASPYVAALSLAFLGEADRLYACLEEAVVRNRTHDLAVAPAFDAYREEPRFRALVRRAGIHEGIAGQ